MVGPEVKLLWERDGVPEFYLIKESSVGMKIKKRIRKSRMVYISPKKYSQGIWALFTRLCEAKAPILWPPDVKSRLTGKDPVSGKDWGHGEKWATEDDSWMALLTQSTWIWANPGRSLLQSSVPQFMGSQRVRNNWAAEQQQEPKLKVHISKKPPMALQHTRYPKFSK